MGQKWLCGCSFNMNHKQLKAATFKQSSYALYGKLAEHQTQAETLKRVQGALKSEQGVAFPFSFMWINFCLSHFCLSLPSLQIKATLPYLQSLSDSCMFPALCCLVAQWWLRNTAKRTDEAYKIDLEQS